MKVLIMILVCTSLSVTRVSAQSDPEVLIGKWKLDMSPQDKSDDNFAMMEIRKVKNNELQGIFYRPGVKIQNGQINTQTERIYGSLISGDNSGSYNTAFYYEDGKLYGTTHAVERGFLSVWVATRVEEF